MTKTKRIYNERNYNLSGSESDYILIAWLNDYKLRVNPPREIFWKVSITSDKHFFY